MTASKNARVAPSGVEGLADGDAGGGPSRPTSNTPPATMTNTATPTAKMTSGRLRSGMRFTSRPRRRGAVDRERHDGRDPRQPKERNASRGGDLDAHGRGAVRRARDRIGARYVRDDDLCRRRDLGR